MLVMFVDITVTWENLICMLVIKPSTLAITIILSKYQFVCVESICKIMLPSDLNVIIIHNIFITQVCMNVIYRDSFPLHTSRQCLKKGKYQSNLHF